MKSFFLVEQSWEKGIVQEEVFSDISKTYKLETLGNGRGLAL